MSRISDYIDTIMTKTSDYPYIRIFDENCVEDAEDNLLILTNAQSILWDKFKIRCNDKKLIGAIFYIAYNALVEYVISKQADYSDYQLCLCNRFVIGFDNTNDEDEEKVGNFALQIEDMNYRVDPATVEDPDVTSLERCVRWKAENVLDQPNEIREVSIAIQKILKKAKIDLSGEEVVMPIFITIYECLINYSMVRRRELNQFEYSINFLSCFYLYARQAGEEATESDDIIAIKPSIADKLGGKNDKNAYSSAQSE